MEVCLFCVDWWAFVHPGMLRWELEVVWRVQMQCLPKAVAEGHPVQGGLLGADKQLNLQRPW